MNRHFFISGGTGFIGRAFVRLLLRQAPELEIGSITLLSRKPQQFADAAPDIIGNSLVRMVQGDIAELVAMPGEFTDIVHGASDVNDLLVSDRAAYYWNIVSGTKRMLDLARQCKCQRFLYLSSGAVYGPGDYPDTGIPENWMTAPPLSDEKSSYGQAKRASEHLCGLVSQNAGMALRIARIFTVVGDEMPLDGQYALGNFIRDALSDTMHSITVNGDGTPVRSYLHVDDVAQWLLRIHEHSAHSAVYNVGSEIKVSIRQLAETVAACSPSPKTVMVMQHANDYAARSVYVPDCTHAHAALGLAETIDLTSAVRRIFSRRLNT